MEEKVLSHITKGLVVSLLLIIANLAGHFLNIVLDTWFSWIGIVIFCVGVIWSVTYYGKQMNNNVTFGNLFAHGFKMSAVIACITFVYTVLSLYVIFPGFIDQVVQKAIDDARSQGKATEEQLQQGMSMIKQITTITLLAGSVLGSLVVGAVASLIGAAITKKNPQDPFAQTIM